ncbi:MAG: benzoyl-CoA reductase subunit A [Planctomycetes bacterium RBG_16_64_12]|nr:MAG: benzoyl-CoA reductase subunit A [Planctomycetes bacterium RBG_16_64_12]
MILDEDGAVVGRGIANSRSSYAVACDVAFTEARINTRFWVVASGLDGAGIDPKRKKRLLAELQRRFRQEQYVAQLSALGKVLHHLLAEQRLGTGVRTSVQRILEGAENDAAGLFAEGAIRKSDFFRDLAGSSYFRLAEKEASGGGPAFDLLVGLYDKAILEVENTPPEAGSYRRHALAALGAMNDPAPELREAVERAAGVELHQVSMVGTGYGRQRLPFPKDQIRSEILCHGLGAHAIFPQTATVLDIGGQDTKAIQVDEQGIVTSFQMNDRCAAGCGRYLGYIADEMNLGLHELGPLAARSSCPVRINSTCTVFAGAEIRDRLSLGQKREDILAGLHRAIILRAMSLLARSGGVRNEFTFTGGVAKNPAAVDPLARLIVENYGPVKLNISPYSIYTGALGAALFALRGRQARRPLEPVLDPPDLIND